MNELPFEKRVVLKRLLASGATYRAIASTLRCSRQTIRRYAAMWEVSVNCACGGPSGHQGWCKTRLDFSPNRRGYLSDHWHKRGGSHLAAEVDRAYREAAALGHQLGRFVLGSSATVTLAYAICGICHASVHLNDGGLRRDVLDGTALRKRCLTAAQRAAQKADAQERREWRKGKTLLRAVKRALRRPSSLPSAASTPAPSSPR